MDEYEDKYISAKELVNTMLEEAEKLPDDLPKGEGLAIATAAQYIRGYIKRVKSADVQPVKHGHWEEEDTMPYDNFVVCSECGMNLSYQNYTKEEWQESFRYCPCCGARMDLKDGDDDETL